MEAANPHKMSHQDRFWQFSIYQINVQGYLFYETINLTLSYPMHLHTKFL